MKEFFAYESKFIHLLMKIADMAIMNMLYILCCIPVFTIGAAQAGLYSGIRQLMNKEDDRSCVRAFFRGFKTGFQQVSLVYLIFLAAIGLLCVLLLWLQFWSYAGANSAPVWMCVAAMGLLALLSAPIGPFHASFSCTTRQLICNVYCVAMAHPVRTIVCAVLIWMPVVHLLVDIYGFLELTVIWVTLYYAMAFLLIHLLMRKPMEEIKEAFLVSQNEGQ